MDNRKNKEEDNFPSWMVMIVSLAMMGICAFGAFKSAEAAVDGGTVYIILTLVLIALALGIGAYAIGTVIEDARIANAKKTSVYRTESYRSLLREKTRGRRR